MKQLATFLLICTLISNLVAQENDKSSVSIFPMADSVLDSLEQTYNRIEDYYARIDISIKTPMLRMPRKRVDFWFKQPNLTKVETKGFAAIPKSGMISSPIDLFDNLSNIAVIGAEYYDDKQAWILQGELLPDSLMFKNMNKIEDANKLTMKMWVDLNNWTLIRSETFMDTFKIVEISSIYKSFPDNVNLPIETKLLFNYRSDMMPQMGGFHGPNSPIVKSNEQDSTKVISGSIIMKYSKYKINQGIDDAFFEKEEPK
jgi:outer membrane lipoprotein-sorting protein